MKKYLGAMVLAAGLAFAGSAAVTPASAAADKPTVPNAQTGQPAATTDMSARRRGGWRGHRRGFYRPAPYYRSYGYYRPRPSYYRPYYRPYYAPAPFISFGFGPRFY